MGIAACVCSDRQDGSGWMDQVISGGWVMIDRPGWGRMGLGRIDQEGARKDRTGQTEQEQEDQAD